MLPFSDSVLREFLSIVLCGLAALSGPLLRIGEGRLGGRWHERGPVLILDVETGASGPLVLHFMISLNRVSENWQL